VSISIQICGRKDKVKQSNLFAPLGLYLLWTIGTYLLEGRINLLQEPTPSGRAIYILTVNVIIGIIMAFWVLRLLMDSGVTNKTQLGFQSLKRTIAISFVAVILGFVLFLLQKPASLNPIAVWNVFSQVLPVTIAEIVVCWAVIGGTFEAITNSKGKLISIIAGIVVADFLFGVYHFAHSAPFNQVNMVLFLMIPGLITSLVYFIGRDIYATILFHNFMGMAGVLSSVDMVLFSQPLYFLYVLMIISVVCLIIWDRFYIRQPLKQPYTQLIPK